MAPHRFRDGNEELWQAPAVNVLQVCGASRSATLEAPDDAADAAAHQGLPAALMDAATLVAKEWEKVTPNSVLHCWLKSNFLPLAMSASLTASEGEYRQMFASVEIDLDEVRAWMRGTSLEREVIGGESEGNPREGMRAWFGAEDEENAIVYTEDMII